MDWMSLWVKPQPSSFQDFNILDLGFVHSIRSLKDHKRTKIIDQIITAVESSACWVQPGKTLKNAFLSLQGTMIDSLTVDGSNSCKIHHTHKDPLYREQSCWCHFFGLQSIGTSSDCDHSWWRVIIKIMRLFDLLVVWQLVVSLGMFVICSSMVFFQCIFSRILSLKGLIILNKNHARECLLFVKRESIRLVLSFSWYFSALF